MKAEIARRAVRGDMEALAFIEALHQIVDLWDDLIDRDKCVSDEEISLAFTNALISLPRNSFYVRHFSLLNPLIDAGITDWHTANALEATKDEINLREAYVLRCSLLTVTIMVAKIIGGPEWARQISFELRTLGDEWPAYSTKHGVT